MKRLISTLVVGAALVAPAASQARIATSAKPAHWTTTVRSTSLTPHVTVDGDFLLIVDLSDHNTTATFYGDNTVVRVHMHGHRVDVLVATTASTESVRVWFTTTSARLGGRRRR